MRKARFVSLVPLVVIVAVAVAAPANAQGAAGQERAASAAKKGKCGMRKAKRSKRSAKALSKALSKALTCEQSRREALEERLARLEKLVGDGVPQGPAGAQGSQGGPAGAQGSQGAAGTWPNALFRVTTVQEAVGTPGSQEMLSKAAKCSAAKGEVAIGGNAYTTMGSQAAVLSGTGGAGMGVFGGQDNEFEAVGWGDHLYVQAICVGKRFVVLPNP